MNPSTFYRIMSAYKKYAKTSGIEVPLQMLRLSARTISEYGNVSRAAVTNGIREMGGFEQTAAGFRITRDFKWADLKSLHEKNAKLDALKAWWESRKEWEEKAIDPAPVGPKVSKHIEELIEKEEKFKKRWISKEHLEMFKDYEEAAQKALAGKDWSQLLTIALALKTMDSHINRT